MVNILGLSGGKDSVALWLWAIRTGLAPMAVYTDTSWEWDEDRGRAGGHYAHLNLLESRIGKIHRVSGAETFAEATKRKGTFPSRVRKWCTEDLKLAPFAAWLDAFREESGDDVRVLLGIRREESAKRADTKMTPEHEYSDLYDCEVWRPILDWTVMDVIAEHRRAAIPMHPLYHHGAERVGCFPCVNASKAELALVAKLQPGRISEIRTIESEIGQTMFTRDRRSEKKRLGDDGPSVVPIGIDEVIAWAITARGGKQIELVRAPTGCARWGVCELPPPDIAW